MKQSTTNLMKFILGLVFGLEVLESQGVRKGHLVRITRIYSLVQILLTTYSSVLNVNTVV